MFLTVLNIPLLCVGKAQSRFPKEDLFINIAQNKTLELNEIREDGKYKVIIKYKRFDKNNHKLQFKRQALIKVDNEKCYGTDGTMPRVEISSISLFELDKEYKFPISQYVSLFNPLLGERFYARNFSVKEKGSHIEIMLNGGDGAGSYEVKWSVSKKSKTVKRQVSDVFTSEKKQKPNTTFSKLEYVHKK